MLHKKNLLKAVYTYIALFFLVVVLLLSQVQLEKGFKYPYNSLTKLRIKQGSFVNFWGVLLGARRLSADLAWIHVLQYYGTIEDDQQYKDEHHHDHDGECTVCNWFKSSYKDMLDYCLAVVSLDPYFNYVYLYGSGSLAWNHQRYDEAVKLLHEGIQNDPDYWKFHLYLAAISYTKEEQYDSVLPLLEEAIKYPDAPVMIKNILAQLYEKNRDYPKAIALWEHILKTTESDKYRKIANRHLINIQQMYLTQ